MSLITDHPLRYKLANELHARPFPSFRAPGVVAYLALKLPENAAGRDRAQDRLDLIALLDRYGAGHPKEGATHYFGDLGRYKIKWEQHTEFVTYTVFSGALSERAFDPAVFDAFPADWLAGLDAVRVTSISIRAELREDEDDISQKLSDWFVSESVAVSRVWTTARLSRPISALMKQATSVSQSLPIRIQVNGVWAASFNGYAKSKPTKACRCRLCHAREIQGRMGQIDAEITDLMKSLAEATQPAETTLAAVLRHSAELESLDAQVAFRFGATWAYQAIVDQRIAVLREERFKGRQTFYEFMMRRYDPAMRTVRSTETRLTTLVDRARRAANCCEPKWMWNDPRKTKPCWKAWINAPTFNCVCKKQLKVSLSWRSAIMPYRWLGIWPTPWQRLLE